MYTYISPLLGEISEDFYDDFISTKIESYSDFIKGMRSKFGYGVLRSGVLVVESEFKDKKVSGTDVYNYLKGFGFSEDDSVNITRLFSVNNRLTENLVERGFGRSDVDYGMDLKSRLEYLGLESSTVTKSYALKDIFTVNSILRIYIPEAPEVTEEEEVEEVSIEMLPPKKLYRSQATFTYTKGKKRVELRIWYQSYDKIDEQTLIDKWNEANDNATSLPSSNLGGLLDSLEPDPGFELNYEIEEDDLVGDKDKWYGVLLFKDLVSDREYKYDVL